MNTAYDKMVERTNNAWKDPDEANDSEQTRHKVIQNGGMVRISMMAMDAMQRQIASQVDRDRPAENKAALDAINRDAEQVQACADHFTAKREAEAREARDENPSRVAYEQRMTDAWRTPATYEVHS